MYYLLTDEFFTPAHASPHLIEEPVDNDDGHCPVCALFEPEDTEYFDDDFQF